MSILLLRRLRIATRYFANMMRMVARLEGYPTAAVFGGRFLLREVAKLPRIVDRARHARSLRRNRGQHPTIYSEAIEQAIRRTPAEQREYTIDAARFWRHVERAGYPKNYAAGPKDEGGRREQKLLEYFVSLELLDVRPDDIVLDVASEWSIFPLVVRELTGATVYRQDLIYPLGQHKDRIGGSATKMPLPNAFATKIVLHNAFEHFEEDTDTAFLREAWRLLQPGGRLCIIPLFVSDTYTIVSDPLVDRQGVTWDEGATVVELPWSHNRFGRFYHTEALTVRVLQPALLLDFQPTIVHIRGVQEVHPRINVYFACVFDKPVPSDAANESF